MSESCDLLDSPNTVELPVGFTIKPHLHDDREHLILRAWFTLSGSPEACNSSAYRAIFAACLAPAATPIDRYALAPSGMVGQFSSMNFDKFTTSYCGYCPMRTEAAAVFATLYSA